MCIETGADCSLHPDGDLAYCQQWIEDSVCHRGTCVTPASCVHEESVDAGADGSDEPQPATGSDGPPATPETSAECTATVRKRQQLAIELSGNLSRVVESALAFLLPQNMSNHTGSIKTFLNASAGRWFASGDANIRELEITYESSIEPVLTSLRRAAALPGLCEAWPDVWGQVLEQTDATFEELNYTRATAITSILAELREEARATVNTSADAAGAGQRHHPPPTLAFAAPAPNTPFEVAFDAYEPGSAGVTPMANYRISVPSGCVRRDAYILDIELDVLVAGAQTFSGRGEIRFFDINMVRNAHNPARGASDQASMSGSGAASVASASAGVSDSTPIRINENTGSVYASADLLEPGQYGPLVIFARSTTAGFSSSQASLLVVVHEGTGGCPEWLLEQSPNLTESGSGSESGSESGSGSGSVPDVAVRTIENTDNADSDDGPALGRAGLIGLVAVLGVLAVVLTAVLRAGCSRGKAESYTADTAEIHMGASDHANANEDAWSTAQTAFAAFAEAEPKSNEPHDGGHIDVTATVVDADANTSEQGHPFVTTQCPTDGAEGVNSVALAAGDLDGMDFFDGLSSGSDGNDSDAGASELPSLAGPAERADEYLTVFGGDDDVTEIDL